MALTLGSVIINPATGAETATGMCGDLYSLLKGQMTPDESELPTKAKVISRQKLAELATAIATWTHDVLTTQAQAKIPTTASGLQRTPNPNNPATDTQGPGADKFLSIV